jgi:hypothetical protein
MTESESVALPLGDAATLHIKLHSSVRYIL